MADFSAAPRLIKNIFLKIGEDTYGRHATDVHTTAPELVVHPGTDTEVHADMPEGGWMLNITGVQDLSEEALHGTLLDLAGTAATVVFSPDGTNYFTVDTVLAAPSQLGGEKNTYGSFTVSQPCTRPERTTAPA